MRLCVKYDRIRIQKHAEAFFTVNVSSGPNAILYRQHLCMYGKVEGLAKSTYSKIDLV